MMRPFVLRYFNCVPEKGNKENKYISVFMGYSKQRRDWRFISASSSGMGSGDEWFRMVQIWTVWTALFSYISNCLWMDWC